MAGKMIKTPRDFPSVEILLQAPELAGALAKVPRPVVARVVREVLAAAKTELARTSKPLPHATLMTSIQDRLQSDARLKVTRIINATGVVIHTNLGRAPLSESIFADIQRTVVGYGNIEFDLRTGKRGGRGAACEDYLATLSGAEAGTIVNNNAAALFLLLNSLANRRKVLISRGELVQIGGGFRIPDILRRSGAKLAEVGTTNITTLKDYEEALDDRTGMILKVHKSNFVQAGFTDEVDLKPLVALGRKHGVPVVNDLGSGVFISTRRLLGYHEPTVQESVRAGADLTCFSGDKLLGGMQSGLIVGRQELIAKIKKNPIFRTMRVDKVVFSVLEKLLAAYCNNTHESDVKLWQILSRPLADLKQMAEKVVSKVGLPELMSVIKTDSYVGGGSMPETPIRSFGIRFDLDVNPRKTLDALRNSQPPVIGRIEHDRLILDLKAIDSSDLAALVKVIKKVISQAGLGR